MDIVILADFCGQLNEQDNNRFLYIADMLSADNEVELVSSDFNHISKTYFTEIRGDYPYKITLLHEGAYRRNVSLKRFAAHYIWGENVKKYLQKRKRPDVIYCAVPTLKAAYEASKYCEIHKVRFIIDLQDLWPEAFKMVFNPPVISRLLYAPFEKLANGIYKRADEIIAVSQTYLDRAKKKNSKAGRGHVIYLGTRLESFDKNVKYNRVFKKRENELWLAYCGTLGSSYDITCVIDALAILRKKGIKPPKFIVMGDGPKRQSFKEYARKKKIEAVFTGNVLYPQMCGRLSACDMTVNPIVKGAAQSIINKHSDYAACGLPVLNTQESREYRKLIDKYEMGFNCNNQDADDLAEKMQILMEDKKLREKMGRNARRCAEERFDRKISYEEIRRLFNEIERRK